MTGEESAALKAGGFASLWGALGESRRWRRHPVLTVEVLLCALLIAFLQLAFPVFTIQIFNRYLVHGHDGTLLALVSGAAIAILFLHGLTQLRTRMIVAINHEPERETAAAAMDALVRARLPALLDRRLAQDTTAEALGRLSVCHAPTNVAALCDFPFSMLYLAGVFLLDPLLGWLCLLFVLFSLAVGLRGATRAFRGAEHLRSEEQARGRLLHQSTAAAETLRLFCGQAFWLRRWKRHVDRLLDGRRGLEHGREADRTIQTTAAFLLNVVLYAVGAMQVVGGGIGVGSLIGATLLAGRCLRNAGQFAQAVHAVLRGGAAAGQLAAIRDLPREPVEGVAIREFSGRLRLADVAFAYEGAATPLFEGLDLEILPGTLLLVCGKNGAGKSTLARLLAGLLVPGRGEILADGVACGQLALPWWRRQLMYLPQEPGFLDATIRENITLARPDIPPEQLERALRLADLPAFLARLPQGINTPLQNGGANLPAGVRKRVALARALATGGRLAILDEPFENIDDDGRRAVAAAVRQLLAERRSVVLCTHDVRNLAGAHCLLDLNDKPRPRLIRCDAGEAGFQVRA